MTGCRPLTCPAGDDPFAADHRLAASIWQENLMRPLT